MDNGLNSEDDYVSIIQSWWQKKIGGNPKYDIIERNKWTYDSYGNNQQIYYEARILIIWNDRNYSFKGEAYSKQKARYE